MAVAEVEVLRAVVVDGNKLSAGVIGVELLDLARAAALHLRHEQAAVVAEGGGDVVHRLARTHALLVVGVARCGVTLALPCQRVAPAPDSFRAYLIDTKQAL